jgi:hypothetical protein
MAQNNNNNNNNNNNQWLQSQPNVLKGAEGKSEPRAYDYRNKDDELKFIAKKSQYIRNMGILTMREAGKVERIGKRVLDETEQQQIEERKKLEAERRRLEVKNTKTLPPSIWSVIEGYVARDVGLKTLVFFDFDPVGFDNPFMESTTIDVYMVDLSKRTYEIGYDVKRCRELPLDRTANLRPQHAADIDRKSDEVIAQMLVTKIGTNAFLTYQMHTWWHIAVFHFEPDQYKQPNREEKCSFMATTFLHQKSSLERASLNPLPLGHAAPHFNRRIGAIVQLENKDLLALGPIVEERYGEKYNPRIGPNTFPMKDVDPHFYQSFADRLPFDENEIITSRQWKKLDTGKPLNPDRMAFRAVQLNDGRVLIMGGYINRVVEEMHGQVMMNVVKTTNTCEYLDISTLQFSNGPSLPEERNGLSLKLLLEEVDDPNELLNVTPLNALYYSELEFDAIKLSNGNVLFSGVGELLHKLCILEFYKDGVYDPNPQWTMFEDVFLDMDFDVCHSLVELNQDYVGIVYKTRTLSSSQGDGYQPEYNYCKILNMKTRKLEPENTLFWRPSDGFYGVGAI